MTVDLDAARRARAERLGNPKAVVGGRAFALRGDFPVRSAVAYSRLIDRTDDDEQLSLDDREALLREVVEGLLVDASEVDAFLANRISVYDLVDVLNDYGSTVGESSASSQPSPNDGKRSRPTSRASTPAKRPSRKRSGKKA